MCARGGQPQRGEQNCTAARGGESERARWTEAETGEVSSLEGCSSGVHGSGGSGGRGVERETHVGGRVVSAPVWRRGVVL